MIPPEFSRPVRIDTLADEPRHLSIEADEVECSALARRFGLVGIKGLSAEAALGRHDQEIVAIGAFSADVRQSCVASGAEIASRIAEPFKIIFRPQPAMPAAEDEVELSASEMDVVFYDGASIDIGEAVAETLSLSLDPYPRAADAEQLLKAAGVKSEAEAGPFGALAGLRDKLSK
ncbi:MAG: DUF177 domain-containing protein [Sphingosinicella sp.]|nr:DUF177 domain-containing protein [Sphingosinicella sp.]